MEGASCYVGREGKGMANHTIEKAADTETGHNQLVQT